MSRTTLPAESEPAEPFFSAEAFKGIDPLTLFALNHSGEVVVTRPPTRHLEISERLCEPQASAAPRAVLKKRADDAGTVAFVASLVLAIVVAVMVPAFLE